MLNHSQKPHHTFMYLWIAGAAVVLVASMASYVMQHPRTALAPVVTETATTTVPAENELTTDTTGVFTLALGETGTSHGWTITPTALEEDSRCPIDVQCIQAGTVRVSVRVGSSTSESIVGLTTPVAIEGGQITLVKVTPDKNSKNPTKPAEYRFSFLVVAQ